MRILNGDKQTFIGKYLSARQFTLISTIVNADAKLINY